MAKLCELFHVGLTKGPVHLFLLYDNRRRFKTEPSQIEDL